MLLDYIDTLPHYDLSDIKTKESYSWDREDFTVLAGPLEVGVYRCISQPFSLENQEHKEALNSMIKDQIRTRDPIIVWVPAEMVELWVPKSQIRKRKYL